MMVCERRMPQIDIEEWLQYISQMLSGDLFAAILLLVGVWGLCFRLAKGLLAGEWRYDRGRQHLARLAANEPLTARYEDAIKLLLSLVDKWAGDRFLERADATRSSQPNPFRHPSPWSNGIYDLTLRLALTYPVLFLFVNWVWSGQSMPGLQVFLPSQSEEWPPRVRGCRSISCLVPIPPEPSSPRLAWWILFQSRWLGCLCCLYC